jgi:hypothetical protein
MKKNIKTCKCKLKKSVVLKRNGGAIIAEGNMHRYNNPVSKQLEKVYATQITKKGTPVLALKNGAYIQVAEVEKNELMLDSKNAKSIDKLVEAFNQTKNEKYLLKLGGFVKNKVQNLKLHD